MLDLEGNIQLCISEATTKLMLFAVSGACPVEGNREEAGVVFPASGGRSHLLRYSRQTEYDHADPGQAEKPASIARGKEGFDRSNRARVIPFFCPI
jgi:hypothetical protein